MPLGRPRSTGRPNIPERPRVADRSSFTGRLIGARVGRVLEFDPGAETIAGDDQAAALVGRRYREGHWAVPRGA